MEKDIETKNNIKSKFGENINNIDSNISSSEVTRKQEVKPSKSPLREEKSSPSKLKSYEQSEVVGSKTIYQNSIFKLCEGVLSSKNSTEKQLPVYLLHLKFFDFFFTSNENINKQNINKNKSKNNNKEENGNIGALIEEIHDNFYKTVFEHSNIISKLGLKKIGYIANEVENKLSFIYLKENFVCFSLEKFIADFNGNVNFQALKIQLILDILSSVRMLHSIGKKVGLINPALIFYDFSNNSFQLIDISLDEYISLINKSMHAQVISNFGYLDVFSVEEIDNDKYESQEDAFNKPYIKTDLLLVLSLLNYLLSTKKITKKKEEFISSVTFEKILNELQKDFLSSNDKLGNFKLSTEGDNYPMIQGLFKDHINLNMLQMNTVYDLIEDLKKIVSEEYDICHNCQDVKLDEYRKELNRKKQLEKEALEEEKRKNYTSNLNVISNNNYNSSLNVVTNTVNLVSSVKPIDKRKLTEAVLISEIKSLGQLFVNDYLERFDKKIKLDCFHVCCKFCYFMHKCNKTHTTKYNPIDSVSLSKEVKQSTDLAIRRMESMSQLKKINLTDYYDREIVPIIVEINKQHDYFKRILLMEEETVESLAEYLEFCLKNQIDSQNEILEKNITVCKEQIKRILSEIEGYKFNNIADNKFRVDAFEEKSRIMNNYGNYNDMTKSFDVSNLINTEIKDKLNETMKGKIDNLLQEKDVCELFGKKIDQSLSKAQEIVSFIGKMKNDLNNHKQMRILLDEIDKAARDYIREFKGIMENDFQQSLESVSVFGEFLKEDHEKMKSYEKFTLQTSESIYDNIASYINSNNELVLIILFGNFVREDLVKEDLAEIDNKRKNEITIIEKDSYRVLIIPLSQFNCDQEKEQKNTADLTIFEEKITSNLPKTSLIKIEENKENKDSKDKDNWKMPLNSRMTTINNKLFVTGGMNYKKPENEEIMRLRGKIIEPEYVSTNDAFIISFNKEAAVKLVNEYKTISLEEYNNSILSIKSSVKIKNITSSRHPRDQHSMLKLNDYEFMAISGYSTKTCEVYSLLDNKWSEYPELPQCIYNTSSFLHNGIYCYIFFGMKGIEDVVSTKERQEKIKLQGLEFLDDVYRLKIYKGGFKTGWEKIKYKYDASKIIFNFILPAIIPCHAEQSLLILGGKHISTEHNSKNNLENSDKEKEQLKQNNLTGNIQAKFSTELSDKIYSFDLLENKIKLVKDVSLSSKSCFLNNLAFINKYYKSKKQEFERESNDKETSELDNQRDNDELDLSYSYRFGLISAERKVVGLISSINNK